jgi:ferric-dicitrate binding protein FerR (iron transport regulator)
MDDIIIRVLNGRAEPIEERRLANWRAESSQNEQHFTEVSAIWDWTGSDALAIDSESLAAAPTLETIVRQGEALNRRDVRRRFARGLGRKEIRPWAAAAVIAAVSLGVWIGRMGPAAGGVLVFQSTPLPQVVEEVSAHFGVAVGIGDPALMARTVTASFADESLDEVVEFICLLVQAECEIGADGVIIGGGALTPEQLRTLRSLGYIQ